MPRENADTERGDGALDLPWLQAVNEKAVSPTTGLDHAKMGVEEEPVASGLTEATEATQHDGSQADMGPGAELEHGMPAEPDVTEEPPDAPPPNWVVGILEPSSGPPAPDGSYEPEELAHIMPWAHKGAEAQAASDDDTGEEEPDEARAALPGDDEDSDSAIPGLPPWLSNVTVQETLQSLPPQDLRNTDIVDLGIEDVEPFTLPVDEDADVAPDQLPDFVRAMGESANAVTEDAPTQPAAMPVGERLITTPPSDYAFDEEIAGIAARDVPVRAPRPGSVETLAQLLQPAGPESTRRVVPMPVVRSRDAMAAEAPHPSTQPRQGRVGRWLFPNGLIYLVMLATLLSVVIIRPPFGDTPAPPAPGVAAFYQAINSVPLDRPVLVVYDWDAGRSAEMSIMSRAVMHHIGLRHLSFVTVSTVPQGPGFAQEITDALRADPAYGYQYGTDYLVLGYLPGSEAALRALVGSFKAVLPLDYVNSRPVDSYQLTAGGALNKIEDFALIVDLAGSEAEMRNWIEQVATRTNVPIVAAVPQGLDPLARPYLGVPGARLEAVVTGTTGAYAYMRHLEQNGLGGSAFTQTVDLTTRLNAQSVAALLVALVIT
ncbi:MAG: hypothetical protein WCD37_04195, partial [Chloroflexia bacterium]